MLALFLVISLSILISVIGHKLFQRTGLPESIFMILMGLLAGPLLNIVDVDELTRIMPSLFTLSLFYLKAGYLLIFLILREQRLLPRCLPGSYFV
jgi:Kef-type K+ transport system membrane component KefB